MGFQMDGDGGITTIKQNEQHVFAGDSVLLLVTSFHVLSRDVTPREVTFRR